MTSDTPEPVSLVLKRIVAVLASHQVVEFAFAGGLAVGIWSSPRQTKDLDICGTLPLKEVDRLLALRDGIRSGSEALPDIVRFRVGDWDVDLFVSKGPYDFESLRRAVTAEVDDVTVRVVTAEDLLVHKMKKLRFDRKRMIQDLADIRAVIDANQSALDWGYIRNWTPAEESSWLEMVAHATDEALIVGLLRP